MKSIIISIIVLASGFSYGQVGINTVNPDPSSILDLNSTVRGFLPPRMTLQQRDAISNPAEGLVIYNKTEGCLNFRDSAGWISLCGGNTGNPSPITQAINKRLGGVDSDYPSTIMQTTDGGYIIAGGSSSSISGDVSGSNNGASDYWILKLDEYGNKAWDKLYGGSSDDTVTDIIKTDDEGYIVSGYTYNDGYSDWRIIKLNRNGNLLWEKLYGGNRNDTTSSIQLTTDGGFIIAGYSNSSANGDVAGTNHGSFDAWVVKTDADGNILWEKLYGGNKQDQANSISHTTDGGFLVAGYSYSSENGDITGTGHGSNDGWIMKLDTNGNIIWNKLYGGSYYDNLQKVIPTNDGGFIAGGTTASSADGDISESNNGGNDIWIIKLDQNGNKLWDKLYGGSADDSFVHILATSDNGYLCIGNTYSSASGDVSGSNHGDRDIWVIKLDQNGNILWNKLYGGAGYDGAASADETIDGKFVITSMSHSTSAGTGDQENVLLKGGFDTWVITIDADGNIIE